MANFAFQGPNMDFILLFTIFFTVGNDNAGKVQFVNTAFWGPGHQIATINGTGTVGFVGCTFCQWNGDDTGRYIPSPPPGLFHRPSPPPPPPILLFFFFFSSLPSFLFLIIFLM